MDDFERLREIGCVLVDTTCGSVLNVWKRVESYARDGFTAIIHGKHYHEETKATASQVMKYPGGRYLVVLNMDEARLVCDFIERGGDPAALAERFANAVSPGFDFARDLDAGGDRQPDHDALRRVAGHRRGVPPQHGAPLRARRRARALPLVRHDLLRHPGAAGRGAWPCSTSRSTHGRGRRLQLEQHLPPRRAGAARAACRVFHIEDADAVDPAAGTIRHQPIGTKHEARRPRLAGRRAGSSASRPGASTPNNKIGETIARICRTAGVDREPSLPDAMSTVHRPPCASSISPIPSRTA